MKRIKYVLLFILILLVSGSVSNKKFITDVDIDRNVMEGNELDINAGALPGCTGTSAHIQWEYIVTSITVAKGDKKIISPHAIYCSAGGAYYDIENFSYSSDDTSIVSVSGSSITGVNYGEANVTVVASTSGKTSSRVITVKVVSGVTGFNFGKEKYAIKLGETVSTSYSVATHEDNLGTVSYTIEDTSIATVDSSGKVTGIKTGTTTLTATGSNGDSTTVPIEVIVPITSVEVTNGEQSVGLGSNFKLEVAFKPENATPRNYSWASSNSGVATVDQEGNVSVIGPGNATISIVTEDGDEFVVKTISLEAAQNNAVDPADNNNNTDVPKNNVPATVDNPATGLFLTLVFGFGLCFVLIGCYYLSKRFKMIKKI